MNGRLAQFAKRQWRLPPAIRHLGTALAVGIVLAFLGPFKTGSTLGTPVRYAFWLGLSLFGYACVLAARRVVRSPSSGPLRLALIAVLSAIPQTFATAWTLSLVQPGRTFGAAHIVALFGPVAVVQLGLAIAAWAASRAPSGVDLPSPTRPSPPFLQRVPARLGRDLIALEAEDHYLRVHTSMGSELVLARLSDAIAQLDGYDGLQTHRSWWVAADAVTGTLTRNGRTAIRLKNGIIAPVSRANVPAVRDRGWPPA